MRCPSEQFPDEPFSALSKMCGNSSDDEFQIRFIAYSANIYFTIHAYRIAPIFSLKSFPAKTTFQNL